MLEADEAIAAIRHYFVSPPAGIVTTTCGEVSFRVANRHRPAFVGIDFHGKS